MSESGSGPCPRVRAEERNGSGTERSGANRSTSTPRHRDFERPVARAREAQNKTGTVRCRVKGCTSEPRAGFVLCDSHEQAWAADKRSWPAETDERQFVRYAFAEDCQLPYRPAGLEPKRRPMRDHETPPINRVLNALLTAGCTYRAGRDVDSWQAFCPTHDDTHPSLQVRRNHDGSVWLKCWAGCSKEAILYALGLEWRDLWDKQEHDPGRAKSCREPLLPEHLRRALLDLLRLDDERKAAA
jgi:hypothetical protein